MNELDLPDLSDAELKRFYDKLKLALSAGNASTDEAHMWMSVNIEIRRRVNGYKYKFIR